MLVFCCGMMRAGSTVQYQLAAEIVEYFGLGKRLGWIDLKNFIEMQKKYGNQEGFFVVKCHNYLDAYDELFSIGEAKAIYAYRDIRDVIISLMNKFNRSFIQIMQDGYIETILRAYHQWNCHSDILVSQYETMIHDLPGVVQSICAHLYIEIDEKLARQMADKFSLHRQVNRIRDFNYRSNGVRLNTGDVLDPNSQLHQNHIFSGNTNQWKTVFFRYQVGLIEYKAYRWLTDRGYPIQEPSIIRFISGMGYSMFFNWLRTLRFLNRQTKKILPQRQL